MSNYTVGQFWDQNLEKEYEESYSTTLLLMYEKLHNYDYSSAKLHNYDYSYPAPYPAPYRKKNGGHTNKTKLELRWHFRAKAYSGELSEWLLSNFINCDEGFNNAIVRSRDVPDMRTYFPKAFEREVEYFFDEHGHRLGIDKQNHGEEVGQWLHNLLMEPEDTLFYCLHCNNQVEIMSINQQHVCPKCGGWYLFEKDYPPLLPTNWDLVCDRLWPPTPDGQELQQQQQPPLRDDVIKEVDIRDLEEFEDSWCPICEVGSTNDAVAGKVIGKLPCGHIFHSDCVSKWFEKKPDRRHCPKCRRLVPTADPLFNIQLALYGMEEDYPPPLP